MVSREGGMGSDCLQRHKIGTAYGEHIARYLNFHQTV